MSLFAMQAFSVVGGDGLKDSNPETRIQAIYAISKGFDTKMVPLVTGMLGDNDAKVRAAAAETLVYFNTNDAATVSGITKALGDSNNDVVKYAVYAVDRLKAKSAIPELKKVLGNKNETIRVNAAVVLGKLGDKSGRKVLETGLNSGDMFIRLRSVIGLRKSGDKSTIPVLKEILKDKDFSLRTNAARTLWELGDKSGKDILLNEAFKQLDLINRWNYAGMLSSPATDKSDGDLVAEAIIQGHGKTGGSPFTQREALQAAERIKPEGIGQVISSFEYMDPKVANESNGISGFDAQAVYVLAELGYKEAVPVIKELMLNANAPRLKMASAGALVLLTGEKEYKDFILSGLKNDFAATRRESAWTMLKLNDKSYVPALEEALKTEKEPLTARVIKQVLENLAGKKYDIKLPEKVIEKKPEPALTDEQKKQLPFGRRPPQFIYFRCDDNSTVEGVETLIDIVKEVGEKGGKVCYNLWAAPYASLDPERIRLCYQYLFDRGTSLNNHSFFHNPQGYQLTAGNIETQLEDTLGCDRWLRKNIRGLDKVLNNRAGGGGGWNMNERVYLTEEIHKRRNEIHQPYSINGKNMLVDKYVWALGENGKDNEWVINAAYVDYTAPPATMLATRPFCEGLIGWNCRIGQLRPDEGIEMVDASFDYIYNSPMRPPLSGTSLHDWEFDEYDQRPGQEAIGPVLKGFLMDVLVNYKDKYPDTYCVTYHQLVTYLKTGDVSKVLAEGNGQTDPEFRKDIDQREQQVYDDMRALSKSFIKEWNVTGPFTAAKFDEKYGPEIKLDSEVEWKKQTIIPEDVVVNFNRVYSVIEDSAAAYGYAIVNSPEKKTANLKIGANDGVKVWLNGKLLLEKYAVRHIKIDDYVIPVTLEKGDNKILIRSDKSYGERPHWGFCCRIED